MKDAEARRMVTDTIVNFDIFLLVPTFVHFLYPFFMKDVGRDDCRTGVMEWVKCGAKSRVTDVIRCGIGRKGFNFFFFEIVVRLCWE